MTRQTWAAPLTPPGRSAVATVAVWGDRTIEMVQFGFRSASDRRLSDFPLGRIALGQWSADPGSGGEDVVLVRTGEHSLEIHCHGGRSAIARILDDLRRQGCHIVSWSDWLARNQEDVLQHQVAIALAAAPTARCAAILLDQQRQALRRAIEQTVEELGQAQTNRARSRLERLLQLAPVGLHLTQPFRVLVSGPVNVGKSSLVNALAGYPRCIVVDQPGTTRDLVRVSLAIDGWPVELTDTAGFRNTTDPLELAGMERAQNEAQQADLILWVQPWNAAEDVSERFLDSQCQNRRTTVLRVASMVDQSADRPEAEGWLPTSAVTGEGLDRLTDAMVARLVPHVPEEGEAVPFLVEHVHGFERALRAIDGEVAMDAIDALQTLLSGRQTP